MTFGSPHWLWCLALVPALLAIFVWNETRRAELLRRLVAVRLQPGLAASVSALKRRLRFLLLLAGLACVIVAMAKPRWGYTWEEVQRKGRDVIVAVDTSKSMLATDLAPDRLTRARLAVQDLIAALPGDRVGLIAFAGNAFLQAPLTIDYAAVLASIQELDTELIPRGGTNIAGAIKVAAEAFGKGESEHRALIIFTDGEELEADAVEAARRQAENFRVFTVGVGSKEGSLIPVPGENGGTEFVRDAQGQYVKSRLDEARLEEIAQAGGGFFVSLQNDAAAVKNLVETGLRPMAEEEIDARESRRPIERYQWPLAAGLALLVASMLIRERVPEKKSRARPGMRAQTPASAPAAAAAAGAAGRASPAARSVPPPLPTKPAKAGAAKARGQSAAVRTVALLGLLALGFPAGAWSRNPGLEQYERKDFKGAYGTFKKQLERNSKSAELHYNAGASAYKAGDYAAALEEFGKAATASDPDTRAKAEYALGNTLYERGARRREPDEKLKEWRNALQHYEQAMKAEPLSEKAKASHEHVRRLIEEMEKGKPPKPEPQKQPSPPPPQQQPQEDSEKDEQAQGQPTPSPEKKEGESGDQAEQERNQQGGSAGKSEDEKQEEARKKGEKPEEEGEQPQDQGDRPSEEQARQDASRKPGERDGTSGEPQEKDPAAGKGEEQRAEAGEGAQASPSPAPPERELSGEIQAQPSGEGENEKPPGEEPAEAVAVPATPGEMSKAQARALLESLKGEDVQIMLMDERKRAEPVVRDW